MSLPTIADCLQSATERLKYSESAKLDAQLLLLDAVNRPDRSYLMAWSDKLVTQAQLTHFQRQLERRINGEPMAYILGHQEFWSLALQCNPSTLIPRADTETLVEQALAFDLPDKARVLDLGTGTGAIALAIKSEQPNWQVSAVDFNPDAVALAISNAKANELVVNIKQSDWFGAFEASRQFDLIVSNPPYIESDDPHLQQGDVRFEPDSALTSGVDGLEDIRIIAEQSLSYLTTHGWLIVEHGYNQAIAVQKIFSACGFKHIQTQSDLAGNDRVTFGQL